mmetsp:Transcript_9650/g.14515  ORF Transcript_9650/g.14515 Transcript_9650/m.14515 type:complete len:180 (-) Transcript_9650:529-1068(-)
MKEGRPFDQKYDQLFASENAGGKGPKRVRAKFINTCMFVKRPQAPLSYFSLANVHFDPKFQNSENELMKDLSSDEAATKNAQTQTDFRESEAQTDPFSPHFLVKESAKDSKVLLLKDLNLGNNLPISQGEINTLNQKIRTNEILSCLPPFTDEASLRLRKKILTKIVGNFLRNETRKIS